MKNLNRFLLAGAITLAILSPFAPDLAPLKAQERVALTAPAFIDAGVTNLRVIFLQLDWESQNIIIRVRPVGTNFIALTNRNPVDFTYTGSQASNLLKTLNTNRFDTVSLHRKIMLKLQADSLIPAGSFVGSPE